MQNYPRLEYLIIDGGSTDNSVEIIRKYEPWLTYWISEPDTGQSHAINKGFKKSSGDFVNWICSDDLLCKNALNNMASCLIKNGMALYIGKGYRINEKSELIDEIFPARIDNLQDLTDIKRFWRKSDSIMQQSTLYPLKAVKNAGYLNEKNHFTMDYELWGKLMLTNIPVIHCNSEIGVFRWYAGQKTSSIDTVTNHLIRTALKLVLSNSNSSAISKLISSIHLLNYGIAYYYGRIRSTIGVKRKFKKFKNAFIGSLYK